MLHSNEVTFPTLIALGLILGGCASTTSTAASHSAPTTGSALLAAQNPVYACVTGGGSNEECRKVARAELARSSPRENFVQARMQQGISREAALRSWRELNRPEVVRTRCTGVGASTIECETSY